MANVVIGIETKSKQEIALIADGLSATETKAEDKEESILNEWAQALDITNLNYTITSAKDIP